jgi:YVTN family beta-propeller protein
VRVGLPALLLSAVVLLVLGVDGASATVAVNRSDPPPPLAFARVRLAPAPANVVVACRSIQARARAVLLCPTLLPRATAASLPGHPPNALAVQPTGDSFRHGIAGVDIGYGAPWEGPGWTAHRWRNTPCCFFHFVVFRRAPGRSAIPSGARPAVLGGKHGLLAAASLKGSYASGLYFGNHVRFLFREHGINWVATLHSFGEAATERLLGRLVAALRPVDAIPMPTAQGIRVGVTPDALAAGSRSLWVASLGQSRNVFRLDPITAKVTARVAARGGGGPHALTFLDGSLWVVTFDGITRIDPRNLERITFLHVGHWPVDALPADKLLWVTDALAFQSRGSLVSVDPRSNRLVGRPIPLGRQPGALAAASGSVWVADELGGTVSRIDPARRRVVARIKVGRMPTAIAAGAGAVWVANTGAGTVSRIDPATNRVAATYRVGLAPRALVVGAGAVWVADTGDGSVRRIDPADGRVTTVRRGLVDPLALTLTGRKLWITTNDGALVEVPVQR